MNNIGDYLNYWHAIRDVIVPTHNPAEYDPFVYEDSAKTILTGIDKDYLTGEVTIPDTVKIIRKNAFYAQNTNKWSVIIPDSVEEIEDAAFRDSNLQEVTFGNGLKKIGSFTFAYNNALKVGALPNGVESIGSFAFQNCGLKNTKFTIPGTVTFMGTKIFGGDSYYMPSEVVVEEGVTEIQDNAFEHLFTGSITLPQSLRKIGNSAFAQSSISKGLTIPENVNEIGSKAFSASYTTNIVLPKAITTIKLSTFEQAKITSIVIPDSVTTVEERAFALASDLTSVTLGAGLTSIGKQAFYYCESLEAITIPSSVTTIENTALTGCTFKSSKFVNNSSAEGSPWGAILEDDSAA